MRYRNLLTAIVLSGIMLAPTIFANAQQDTVTPQNNTVMNRYTYSPEQYQQGSSTDAMKIFPNPVNTGNTNLYINSIKERDNGEMVIYNTNGNVVMRNTVQNGNNDVNVGNLSAGSYIVKVFTKDRYIYTKRLVVAR